MGMISKI